MDVVIEGWDALRRKLGQDFGPTIRGITFAIGKQLRKTIRVAPKKTGGPVAWASVRQRIWYHAARRKQGLALEYTRRSDSWSERLEDSWAVRNVGQFDAVVENGATYGAYVQRDPRHGEGIVQQPMHAVTGWITDMQAIDEVNKSGKPEHIARDMIEHALSRG